jgi:hypothetical protein
MLPYLQQESSLQRRYKSRLSRRDLCHWRHQNGHHHARQAFVCVVLSAHSYRCPICAAWTMCVQRRYRCPGRSYLQQRQAGPTLAPTPSSLACTTSQFVDPPQVSHRRQATLASTSSHVKPPVYQPVLVAHDPHNTHSMATRRVARITKPMDHLQLSTVTSLTISPIPTSVRSMLTDPHW